MLKKRGRQPIPEPAIDRYVPPKKPPFPWSKFLTVTAFFYEYTRPLAVKC
jgi:hypothetical protein